MNKEYYIYEQVDHKEDVLAERLIPDEIVEQIKSDAVEDNIIKYSEIVDECIAAIQDIHNVYDVRTGNSRKADKETLDTAVKRLNDLKLRKSLYS